MINQETLYELNTLVVEYQKELNQWFRNVLLMGSTLFGILVSFYKPGTLGISAYIFGIGLCLLGLGVLAGSIVLGLSAHLAKKRFLSLKESILNTSKNYSDSSIKAGNASKIFLISQWFSYISLFLSVLFFVAYVLSDILNIN